MEPVPQIDLLASLAFAGQFCACAMLATLKIPRATTRHASQRIMLPPLGEAQWHTLPGPSAHYN
jgi:hypothetical protein